MRCLCLGRCTCGTPEVEIDPRVKAFADGVRERESEWLVKYGSCEYNLRRGIKPPNVNQQGSVSLRRSIWSLIRVLAPMSVTPSYAQLNTVSTFNI
jgi:hypothetical protein